MVSTVILVLLLLGGSVLAAWLHFRVVGAEPSPFELKDEHVARMEAHVPVEGPGEAPGKRRQGRHAIALTDRRLVLFRWGRRVVDVPHELAGVAPVHSAGHRLALELKQGGARLGRTGLYLVYTAKPALWVAEIRRWREIAGNSQAAGDDLDGQKG